MTIRKLFGFQVFVTVAALVAMAAVELLFSLTIMMRWDIGLFASMIAILSVALLGTQLFFRVIFNREFYNAVDYACLLMSLPIVLGVAQFVYDAYGPWKADIHAGLPMASTNAISAAQIFKGAHCSGIETDRAVTAVTIQRCEAADRTLSWFTEHPDPDAKALQAFQQENFNARIAPKLTADALAAIVTRGGRARNDAEQESFDFDSLRGYVHSAGRLSAIHAQLSAQQDGARFWMDVSNNKKFRFFSFILALNVILFKLGLIASKLPRA